MRILTMAALVATQVAAAQPVLAAEFQDEARVGMGAFGGLRIRMPLGPDPERKGLSAGLTLGPTLQTRSANGEIRTRFGEGLEFGLRADRPLSFSLAGRDLSGRRFGAAQDDGEDDTLPRVALAVAGIVVTLGLLYWGVSEALDCDAEEECS